MTWILGSENSHCLEKYRINEELNLDSRGYCLDDLLCQLSHPFPVDVSYFDSGTKNANCLNSSRTLVIFAKTIRIGFTNVFLFYVYIYLSNKLSMEIRFVL